MQQATHAKKCDGKSQCPSYMAASAKMPGRYQKKRLNARKISEKETVKDEKELHSIYTDIDLKFSTTFFFYIILKEKSFASGFCCNVKYFKHVGLFLCTNAAC